MQWRKTARYVLSLLVLLLGAQTQAAPSQGGALLWNPALEGLQGWTKPHHLSCTAKDGLLQLDLLKADSWIILEGIHLDPKAVQSILIRYKALDFVAPSTSGEIFFATEDKGFQGDRYIQVPTLKLDGAWHELLLPIEKYLRGSIESWREQGPITALRLDLVNQTPGRIILESILAGPNFDHLQAADIRIQSPSWYFLRTSDFLQSSSNGYRCELSLPPGNFQIWGHALDIPRGLDAMKDLTFFGAEKIAPRIQHTAQQRWFHLATSKGGPLSMSLTQPPSIYLDSLVISEGNARPQRRYAAPLHSRDSTIQTLEESPAPARPGPYWEGAMLAYPGAIEANAKTGRKHAYFRKIFRAPETLSDAWLQVAVDNLHRSFINGTEVASQLTGNSWKTPTLVEITAQILPGELNCIAIESINTGGASGMLAEITLNSNEDSSTRILSDTSWRCAKQGDPGWKEVAFDAAHWLESLAQPGPPNAPWNSPIPYTDKSPQARTICVGCMMHATVSPEKPQDFAFRFRSKKPIQAGEVLSILLHPEGEESTLIAKDFVLSAMQVKEEAPGNYKISNLHLPISRWHPSMKLWVELRMPGRKLQLPPKASRSFRYENAIPGASLFSKVITHHGAPQLFVNNMPIYPLIGNGEGRKRPGTKESCKAAGFNVEALWIDPAGETQWWRGPKEYDFTVVDQKIIHDLEYNPEVYLLPILWASPPPWWGERYPEEMARFQDGSCWEYYKSAHSFASKQWRKDAAEAITAFVKHIEAMPYAQRILGYWIIGGVSAEWQGWGAHAAASNKHMMDYSAPATQGFRRFLSQKYPERAGAFEYALIPGIETRLEGKLGLFRDPTTAGSAIDFCEFYSESMADALLHCCAAAKKAVENRKIVGTYFGYSMEYSNMDWALHLSGHNSLRKVLDSPDIDFLSAPPSYAVRRLGEDQAWMWPFRSIQNAGKLVWVDDDTRTFLSGPCAYDPALTLEETRAALQRNFGKSLCRLCPHGFYAITSGRELAHPALARDIRILKRAGDFALEREVERHAEIAVLVDEDSIKYLAPTGEKHFSGDWDRIAHWNGKVQLSKRMVNPLMGDLVSYQRGRIARIGAPVDYLLFSDLPTLKHDYKLYIMLNTFQYNEEIHAAVWGKLYATPDTTVLWCYAPGLIHQGRADSINMENLTGIRFSMEERPRAPRLQLTSLVHPFVNKLHDLSFGATYPITPRFHVSDEEAESLGIYLDGGEIAVAMKEIQEATVLYCGSNKLSAAWLQQVARAAGVHLFSESLDPIEGNDHFLMLHSTEGGEKTLRLPKAADIVDVYGGRVLALNRRTFTINLPARSTRLFYIGESRDFLDFMQAAEVY